MLQDKTYIFLMLPTTTKKTEAAEKWTVDKKF